MSLYTGRQNISIPIYTVMEGDIALPITLDYSSGGIKVSQIASSCGLGWNLNAGGMISRATVGRPDETATFGYWYSPYKPWSDYTLQEKNDFGYGIIDGQPDEFYYNFPSGSGRFLFNKSKKPVLIPLKNYKITYDPAIMFTSAYTGPTDFIPGWKITDDNGFKHTFRAYEKGDMIPYLVVDGTESSGTSINQTLNTWYLTEVESPKGNKLNIEYENVLLSYDLPPSKTVYNKVSGGGQEPVSFKEKQRFIINTKKVKKISFSNGTVEFQYSANSRPDLIGDKALEKIVIKNKEGNIIKQYALAYKCLDGPSLNPLSQYSTAGENNYFSPQQTFTPSAPMSRRLMLESITEQDPSNVNLGNGYSFDYIHDIGLPNRASENIDYWGFANGTTTVPEFVALVPPGGSSSGQPFNWYLTGKDPSFNYAKQGTLSKITYPEGGSTTFEYESNVVATVLPTMPPILVPSIEVGASFSFAHSLYGKPIYEADGPSYSWKKDGLGRDVKHYYVEFTVTNAGNYEIALQNMPYYSTGVIYAYLKDMADTLRTPWSSNINGTYHVNLSGGIHRLYIAPSLDLVNQSSNSNYNTLIGVSISGLKTYTLHSMPPGANVRDFGGIRVKQVSSFDPVSSKSLIKTYSYDLNGEGSGQALGTPLFAYPQRIISQTSSGVTESYYLVFSYNSIYPLTTTVGGYVGYNFVGETSKDIGGATLGRTDYTFINPDMEPDFVFSPATDASGTFTPPTMLPDPPIENRDWLRGQLLRQTDYDKNNNVIKEVINEYERFTEENNINGFKVTTSVDDRSGGIDSYYYTGFNYKTGHHFLKRKTELMYDLNSSISTRFDYVQSPKSLLPVKETVTQSDQDSIISYTSYPKEYTPGNSFIDSLVNSNIVSAPVEIVQSKKSANGSEQIVSGTLNTYYPSGKGLAKSVEALKLSTPLALSGFKFSNAPAGQIPTLNNQSVYAIDPKYENKVQYNKYDTRGNLLEQQKANDVKEVYLWGYKGQYPVVKVIGSDLATVLSIASVDTSVLNNGTPAQIQAQLTLIRNHFSSTAVQVSTYMYKPLIGISSETDPTGKTILYEYDSFGRLNFIKDEQGNILKKFCYNYMGQVVDCNQ